MSFASAEVSLQAEHLQQTATLLDDAFQYRVSNLDTYSTPHPTLIRAHPKSMACTSFSHQETIH